VGRPAPQQAHPADPRGLGDGWSGTLGEGRCSNTARRLDAGHRRGVRPTRRLAGVIVADASWVIALSDPADPHHAAAVALNRSTIDEVVVLHPITLAECLVGPASSGLLDEAAGSLRSAFTIATVDADAPLRWTSLRAATGLRLPDSIVLDTAVVGGASAILTFDRQLAAEATGRSIACPT